MSRAELTVRLVAIRGRAWRLLSSAWGDLVAARAEIFVATSLLGGWLLVTRGIALLVPNRDATWALSLGLLLLSLCGWRFLYEIVSRGLYRLSRDGGAKPNA